MSTIIKDLPVKLTEEEVLLRGGSLASTVEQLVALEAEAKDAAKAFKEKIDAAKKEVVRLSIVVRSKHESRSVECTEMLHGNVVELYRTDTGELVSSRAATPEDRQGALFAISGGKSRDEADA